MGSVLATARAADTIRLLIAEDDAPLRSVVSRELARRGYHVTLAEDGRQAVACLEAESFDVALLDVRMPELDGLEVLAVARKLEPPPEVVMLTGNATVALAVEAMKLGAFDFVTKPYALDALDQILRQAVRKRALERENAAMKRLLERERPAAFVFESEAMRKIEELIERVAPSEHTVLLVGESGTGKELAAQAIHRASPRTSVPLVDVNCGAIPENLLESELFGHEKGAFTGAEAARPGLFEIAHRGTLFLDEIGELPMGLQVKLLRVLETKTFYRVGGRRRIDVDTRVIAATNRELNREVEQGRFRKDLFYRINGIEIRLPTLRERPEDVPLLARHFAAPRTISTPAMETLVRYPWPGNVRELKNVIDRATLMGTGPVIEARDLLLAVVEPTHAPVAANLDGSTDLPPAQTGGSGPLREIEKQQILAVLEQVRWHRGQAAELLGISPKTLYRKLRSYGIAN